MKKTTRYYRNALKASNQEIIEFKDKDFVALAEKEISKGLLPINKLNEDLKIQWKSDKDDDPEYKPIIIATKILYLDYVYTKSINNDVNELTALLYIPAQIDKEGKLSVPDDNQLPWIPREYLEPMCESVLSFGKMEDLDAFYSSTDADRCQFTSWEKYYDYAKKLFKSVTKVDFENGEINHHGQIYSFDTNAYVFLNDRINAAQNIIALYDYLNVHEENDLYSKFTSGEEQKIKPLIDINSISEMKKHVGQMNGEYGLAPSQRNAITHFVNIDKGDILAVSGPPGTGKTTLLQSIVANMYVERALAKKEAPVIVAASTNNQAVTNIIDSFGKIKICFDNLFESKWITGSNSFATYMPSQMKIEEAKRKGYQYTDINGNAFFESIEDEKNRQASKESFLKQYNEFYDEDKSDISDCKNLIHERLLELDGQRNKCLDHISDIQELLRKELSLGLSNMRIERCDVLSEREKKLNDIIDELDSNIAKIQEKKKQSEQRKQRYLRRYNEWQEAYYNLPWYIRLFKFFKFCKRRIESFIFGFMTDEEELFLRRDMDYETIILSYQKQIPSLGKEILDLQERIDGLNKEKAFCEEERKKLNRLVSYVINIFATMYGTLPALKKKAPDIQVIKKKTVQELNDLLDVIRYVEFWLSVHYYESEWLEIDNPITEKQKGRTYKNVITTRYRRLSMLTPCFVMTFYMLPKNFRAYTGNENSYLYINDLIDLLIVDEAGQATLEVAAASFSLANKAVVVGDEKQIPPVYGISRAVDCTIAKEQKLIGDYSEFELLEKTRLTCSSSSVMGRALLCCAYDEYEHGLFLSEHRRCYNEIISYCNDLLYGGRLEPKRGTAFNPQNVILPEPYDVGIKPMCYIPVDSDKSEKVGTSRINEKEASEITNWIINNYNTLCSSYKDLKEEEVLAVITPFKSQSNLLKKRLKEANEYISGKVEIGTVHTFQGGEKRVIIFSTVYGMDDGYYFIKTNANLMNVAVSRAKDAFIVFGDLRGFQKNESTPDGLLRKYVGYNS